MPLFKFYPTLQSIPAYKHINIIQLGMNEEDAGVSHTLTGSQEVYLKNLKGTWGNSMPSNLELLFSMDTKGLKIEAEKQIQHLNELKVDKNKSSKIVRKGWEVLEKFVESKSSELKKKDVIAIAYGSMIFDDANNLDYDVLLVSEHDNPDMYRVYAVDWNKEMNEIGRI